ncbi:HD domain-containing protein [Desulfovibrio sp. OttesenSCG-928-C14]|nr:HD domain-containing protein [Desulfovibrio sp. OttesenSCG-928-C14]
MLHVTIEPDTLIQSFINVMEAKDSYTQGHSHHVNVIVSAIFDCLPKSLQHRTDKEKLNLAASLHDIGKIVTPSHVLNKDGALNDEEWQIMRQHPSASKALLEGTPFAELGDWVLYHHERMDGRGYYGLTGEEIPFESRIIAIADTFSALRTYRIYRPAQTTTNTIRIMREAAGTQLDSELLEYFFALGQECLENLECNCEICRQRRLYLESLSAGSAAQGKDKLTIA